jgi:N-acetylglucosaminyldiphosphoundecaprenol N-acetyl-beta-D-mannosaminyltransferase
LKASHEKPMQRKGHSVLGASIDALNWDEALEKIVTWGERRESRYVCICNVHSVVTTTQDQGFRQAVNDADMATPDGAPIAWSLRRFGFSGQDRINGPDLMWRYLAEAERLGQKVFFYGSSDPTLSKLASVLAKRFPALRIAGMHSPPYRELTPEEDEQETAMINDSGANIVFVGLGCPKQEKWMAAHRGGIRAVMIGVGAAFDYHSGVIKRAPVWWQRNGLEWLYRLCSEPRRLMKRYMVTNTLFIIGISRQLISQKILK